MIWGVGTGRCGTKSLAKMLGGLHEPDPWLRGLPVEYYNAGEGGDKERGVGVRDELLIRLRGRALMDTPAIVDLKQSYCMDLIVEVDPDAVFVWIIREPIPCIASFLAGGSWTDTDHQGIWKIMPPGGWERDTGYEDCDRMERIKRAAYHWEHTNVIIRRSLDELGHDWSVMFTTELPPSIHENKRPDSKDWRYSAWEKAWLGRWLLGLGELGDKGIDELMADWQEADSLLDDWRAGRF